jgi:hypothetical protein
MKSKVILFLSFLFGILLCPADLSSQNIFEKKLKPLLDSCQFESHFSENGCSFTYCENVDCIKIALVFSEPGENKEYNSVSIVSPLLILNKTTNQSVSLLRKLDEINSLCFFGKVTTFPGDDNSLIVCYVNSFWLENLNVDILGKGVSVAFYFAKNYKKELEVFNQ